MEALLLSYVTITDVSLILESLPVPNGRLPQIAADRHSMTRDSRTPSSLTAFSKTEEQDIHCPRWF